MFFNQPIASWQDWSKVYQSIPAFAPLAAHILQKENLPAAPLEHLSPGTNAVFRAGDVVLKIFAPPESGFNNSPCEASMGDDLQTELFAIKRANRLGIHAPRLIAEGIVDDKYRFAYMAMEFIEGEEFTPKNMSEKEKFAFGQKLRAITDKMNTPCEPFNGVDVLHDKTRWERWDKFSEHFREERAAWIEAHDFGEFVFVHGDLNGDNILIAPNGELTVIDFADAVLAPIAYEHALVAAALNFDPALMRGYFGEEPVESLARRCFEGTLIHDFGGDIAAERIAPPEEIGCLEELRRKIYHKIGGALSWPFAS